MILGARACPVQRTDNAEALGRIDVFKDQQRSLCGWSGGRREVGYMVLNKIETGQF